MFDRLKDNLEEGHHIYIHCSAGIHRTGMIANALLRYLGYTADESEALIAELRTHTAEGVGEHRLAWGDQFAQKEK
jgi:protein-tyrosine phosphatase